MSRERLTQKTAETVVNDVYTMNNPEHAKNDPKMDEYVIGDPSKFGEDVNKDTSWKNDEKTRDSKTNHPSNGEIAKSAAEAVKQAKALEEKAVKCIIASQRILPGAPDSVVEEQATDLMYLPMQAVNAMLTRQEKLAMSIVKASEEAEGDAEGEEGEKPATPANKPANKPAKPEGEEVEAGKKGEMPAGFAAMMEAKKDKKDSDEPVEAAKKEEKDPVVEVEAKKDDKDPMKAMEEKLSAITKELEMLKGGKKPEEKVPEACDKPVDAGQNDPKEFYGQGMTEKEQTEGDGKKGKEAGDSLIDDIFNSVMASDEKKGAKTLSGLVKKEASDGSGLDGASLWGAPPDVSAYFDTRS